MLVTLVDDVAAEAVRRQLQKRLISTTPSCMQLCVRLYMLAWQLHCAYEIAYLCKVRLELLDELLLYRERRRRVEERLQQSAGGCVLGQLQHVVVIECDETTETKTISVRWRLLKDHVHVCEYVSSANVYARVVVLGK